MSVRWSARRSSRPDRRPAPAGASRSPARASRGLGGTPGGPAGSRAPRLPRLAVAAVAPAVAAALVALSAAQAPAQAPAQALQAAAEPVAAAGSTSPAGNRVGTVATASGPLSPVGDRARTAAGAAAPAGSGVAAPGYTTSEYLPGVEADLYLPRPRHRTVPLVVMVPGGGWQTADRTGLGQLAAALAGRGVAVSNATYRIGQEATRFPVPAQDVTCALDAAVAALLERGLRADPVVLLGHSAGAHLSSLAAFGGRAFRTPQCPYPRARVDGWVGLSGIYDLTVVGPYAWTMMGATAEEAPALYARAATSTYLATRGRPRTDALVIQGDVDEILGSTSIATDFARLLAERRYRTQVTIVPGADHNATYQAPVVAGTILTWLRSVDAH